MFGRKDKKTIAGLPPHHQALANEHQLVASLTATQWQELLVSLRHHNEVVKKRQLPPRTLDFIMPLLRILLVDIPSDGYLGLRADLRGPEADGKATAPQMLPTPPRVKSIEQVFFFDPWIALEAKLNNKAKLDLWIADVVRERKIHKYSSSGKLKVKYKRKSTQRVRVRLSVPASLPVVAPATGVPPWCRISMEREGDRTTIDARSRYPIVVPDHKRGLLNTAKPQAPGAPSQGQLNNVLLLLGEVFRWLPKQQSQAAS